VEFELVIDGRLDTVDLADGEHSVGRAPGNDIQLPVASVSKQHAMLRVEGERVFVRDVGSTNGTDIDGAPVGQTEVELPEQATVRFAGVPLWRRVASVDSMATLLPENDVQSSTVFRPGDEVTDTARARIVEMLGGLFELIASEEDSEGIEQAACSFVSDWIDADRVFLLEDEGEGTELAVKHRWVRVEGPHEAREVVRMSSTIVRQVLEERTSVLVANTVNDPRFAAQQSIIHLDLKSAMAAPLFDNQRVRGILYVDCSRAAVQYGTEDLQVLTATANAVAVKLRSLTLEKEIRTAARIQRAMLPHRVNVPEGWEVDAHLTMCRDVGGDLYHCLQRPNGRTMLVLGDVAGKGVPASLAMAATIVLIRSLNEIGVSLEEMAPHLNAQLAESLAPEQFVTLFVGELDHANGELTYFNAGHEPPRLLRRDSEKIELIDSTGRPIGLLPFGDFGVERVTIGPGDVLSVFSDGIPEATRDGNEFLGDAPVDRAMREFRSAPLKQMRESILGSVHDFLAPHEASDDVTLLLLRRTADSGDTALPADA
jgi:sigma-B regulation protein RsbU (phosphoserine phosphatase)